MKVIGMMSGTSYDAIDAAAAEIRLHGEILTLEPLGLVSASYPDTLLADLIAAMPPASTSLAQVAQLDTRIGQSFADLAARAVEELCDGAVDLIVSHGQTLYHWVQDEAVRGTLQVGQPAWIAEQTGCTVVSDLRSRDVAAGGQGAPLVSAFDALWLRGRERASAALNLGGIANITVVGPHAPPIAFDTGPANALVDAAVSHFTRGEMAYDDGGRLAASGTVHQGLLDRLLTEEYYRRPAPKTTGKELFHLPYLMEAMSGFDVLSPADVVATATMLTARTVSDAVRSAGAHEIIASGGGTANPTMMAMLRAQGGPISVLTSDELGVPAGAKEAHAFAVLGFLTVHGLPGTVPSCTGARHASILGSITPGLQPLQPPPAVTAPTTLRILP